MQRAEEMTGSESSSTAHGEIARTGAQTMVQPTSSTAHTVAVPAAVTPPPSEAAPPDVVTHPRDSANTFAGCPELRAEALRALGTLRVDVLELALAVLRRMTPSPEVVWARLMGDEQPAMTAFKAAVRKGANPVERTRQVHGVLLDLLDGLGADDLFLLVRLVCRITKSSGVAPDSLTAESERFFAGEGTERGPVDTSEQLPLEWTAPDSSPGEAAEPPSPPIPEPETPMPNEEPVPDTLRHVSTLSSRVELDNLLDPLGPDEIAVLARIAKRLDMGRKTYGPLRVELDPRAFRSKEAREELEDFMVYIACAWLKAETMGASS
jgi:hypothetical protein